MTLEPEPEVAEQLFGTGIEQGRRFATNLAERGEELGLIGPLELPRLWSRHILNCAAVAPLLRAGRVGDIGSGAGLPGIVLAIIRPDAHVTLIEPMERRVNWLNEQVNDLGLTNVTVNRARAEDAGIHRHLDQVTARAVSALSKLMPISAPLVRPGGELVLMKGASAEREIEAAHKVIKKFHLKNVEVITVGTGVLSEPTRVVRATVD